MIQSLGFKKHEWLAQGTATKRFRTFWESAGMREALGLSSLGPTMYVLTTRPYEVAEVIRAFEMSPLHLTVTGIAKAGAEVTEGV